MLQIDVFLEILNQQGLNSFLFADYKQYESQIIELKSLDLIKDNGSSNSLICDKCEIPHPVQLKSFPKRNFGWRCPETGFHKAERIDASRALGILDIEKFVELMKKSFSITREYQSINNTDDIVCLGAFKFGSVEALAMLCSNFSTIEEQNKLLSFFEREIIQRHFQKKINFIFTLEDMGYLEFKNDIFLIPFSLIAEIKHKNLIVNFEKINSFLPNNKKVKFSEGKKGRSSVMPNIDTIVKQLKRDKKELSKKNIMESYSKEFNEGVSERSIGRYFDENPIKKLSKNT